MSTIGNAVTESPIIVIVPASFSPPSLYSALVEVLDRHGYTTIVVQLPSVGSRAPLPSAAMSEDADYINAVTTNLAEKGKDIVLVMHSYGGICGTESVRGVTKAERAVAGKKGGIIRLLYISSPVPGVGESIGMLMGGNMPEFITVKGDYMIPDPEGCARTNFSDLPLDKGIQFARMMSVHSTVSFTGPLTYPGYQHVPVSYLVCEDDHAVPVEIQRSIIARIQDESRHEVDVHSSKAGHFPSVSCPEEVARIIRCVARARVS